MMGSPTRRGVLMDEILPFALPLAAAAAVAALVRPARERVVPVAKAVGRAGAGVGGATVAGGRGIVDAAMHGERGAEAPEQAERGEATAGPSRRRPAKSTAS